MMGMCRKVLGGLRGKGVRCAALVRVMAGQAAGVVGGRRGSVLVLILGAIAMLAVVTVAYVTVGASDRRTGSVVVGRDRVAGTVDAIADHIARVIGDDALAVYPDGEDIQLPNAFSPGDPGPAYVREAWDAPLVDPAMLSVLADPPNEQHLRFNPAGTIERPWPGGGIDPRIPSDPFLSSPEPVWLEGDHFASASTPPPPEEIYLYKRDWAVISNIGPSGNPVNLWNLAPVVGGVRRSNFDAQSGFGTFGPQNMPRMSENLSLFGEDDRHNVSPPGSATTFTWYGVDVGVGTLERHPFYWTTHQRGAFRPALEARNGIGPEDPEYLHYQWADADGDGMLDSRWFELVDVSDPDNPVSVLPRDDRFRWFVASRVIDLSGLANVNTAIDFRLARDRGSPTGITPGDVDLRRLLRMVDPYVQWNGALGYAGLEPFLAGPDPYVVYDGLTALDVGDLGDQALRLAVNDGTLPFFNASIGVAPYQFNALPAPGRSDLYRRVGGHGVGASFSGGPGNPLLLTTGGLFGLPDQLELGTYWGVNDPSTRSRLEQAVGGRFCPNSSPSAGAPEHHQLSPLRDNRGLQLERGGHDNNGPGGLGNGAPDPDALELAAFDVRRLLTTVSWARLLRSSTLLTGFKDQMDPLGDQKIDAIASLQQAAPMPPPAPVVQPDAGLLFAGYAEALLPHSWRTNAWNTAAAGDPLRTLAYGHDPVLAMWCAAHMAVNAIDMYDDDTVNNGRAVSAFTLALSGVPNHLTNTIDMNCPAAGGNGPFLYPYWTPRPAAVVPANQPRPLRPGTLDLDYALRLRDTNAAPTQDPSRMARANDLGTLPVAMNVFGMEAQPFITQVASFTIYTDAAARAYAAGDPDADEWIDPASQPGVTAEVNIRGDVADGNPDIVCQVLAFQLTNPFDEQVRLSTSDAVAHGSQVNIDNEFSEFYIEFGGHFFKLVEDDAVNVAFKQIVLDRRDAGGTQRSNTRTVYVLNEPLADIQQRFEDASLGGLVGIPSTTRDEVLRIIERQISTVFTGASAGGNPPTERPILIARMNPNTGQVLNDGFKDLMRGTDDECRVVKLWRRYETAAITTPADKKKDDILVDRLLDPVPETPAGPRTLDRRLDSGQHDITGTVAGRDPTAGGTLASAQDNTGYSICLWATVKRPDNPNDPAGHVARGALPAYCIEVRKGAGNSINKDYPPAMSAIGGSMAQCNFVGGPCPSGGINLSEGDNFLVNTTGGLSSKLSDPGIAPRLDSITKFPEDKSDPNDIISTQPGSGLFYWQVYPEVHLNNDRFRDVSGTGRLGATMRIGDMLLPMCIGPTQVPDVNLSVDQQWITFGETLALAINYADVDASVDPHFAFLDGLARDSAGRPATDRGNLRLDRFVPFENVTQTGTAIVFNPGTDIPRAPHVPLGATVLDVFRTIDPDLGSLERGVQGYVNVNTAPSRVLKALPMACPNPAPNDYWGSTSGALLPQPAAPFGTSGGSDYGATIEAFRDKLAVTTLNGETVTFQESAAAYTTLDDPSTWNGRTTTNQDVTGTGANIEPIREAPGMASMGELFGATEGPGGTGGQNGTRVPLRHQIDELGRERAANGAPNPANSGAEGVNSTLYGPVGSKVINEIRDDYAEKLAVAGSIAGTASVRSDTFACWMVIHGYQRSDCEGLSDTVNRADPLSPTIAKRYLMIVDRSNVTRLGDKPRILMMQEVPF